MTVNQFNLIGKKLQYKMKKKPEVNQMLLNIARVFGMCTDTYTVISPGNNRQQHTQEQPGAFG